MHRQELKKSSPTRERINEITKHQIQKLVIIRITVFQSLTIGPTCFVQLHQPNIWNQNGKNKRMIQFVIRNISKYLEKRAEIHYTLKMKSANECYGLHD
jgi:hypothetical protein